MKPIDQCRLYTFVDTAYLRGSDPVEVARQLCRGGADLVQLRAKESRVDEVLRLAESIQRVTEEFDVGLVINDHPEVAVRVGAMACHLGQEDFFGAGLTTAKDVAPGGIPVGLGLSTHSPEQGARAIKAGPDYIAIGPVYPTPTKPLAPAVSLDYVRWAAGTVKIPWFAIGGITLKNLREVLDAGATRICVVSAILQAPDVAAACREFRNQLALPAP